MVELVHHTEESANGGLSPFDTAIRGVADDENVLIACPYITLDYLESVLRDAESWRLLTDTEAWLDNYSTTEREAIREFIARNHNRIHDVRNLHAKAVVGESSALVGSANLTRMGVARRDELAVRLNEPERIAELRGWFEDLWEEGSPANLDDIDDRIRTASPVPSSASGGGGTSIASSARRVSASITEGNTENRRFDGADQEEQDAYKQLIAQASRAPNREWLEKHLELLNYLLSKIEIRKSEPTLFMSITQAGKLHTTINTRLVFGIQPFRNRTLFILSTDTPQIEQLSAQAVYSDIFRDSDGNKEAYLLGFEDGLTRVTDSEFKTGWMKAVRNEWNRDYGDISPYRVKNTHQPIVYQAAVDHEFRERVLDEAFGT